MWFIQIGYPETIFVLYILAWTTNNIKRQSNLTGLLYLHNQNEVHYKIILCKCEAESRVVSDLYCTWNNGTLCNSNLSVRLHEGIVIIHQRNDKGLNQIHGYLIIRFNM